jgi:hypothetical protein
MRKINWTCPDCGNGEIAMITENATVETPIIGVYDDIEEPVFDTAHDVIYDNEPCYRYECKQCSHLIVKGRDADFISAIRHLIVPDDKDTDSLADHVKNNT